MENPQIRENKTYLEDNSVVYENDSTYDFSLETNKTIKAKVLQKQEKRTSLNIISKFVFMCAVVATIQVGIYIPIFSDIFNISQSEAQAPSYVTSVSTSLSFDTNYKYLKISLKFDPSFDDFNAIYIQLYDISTNTPLPNYSQQNKENAKNPDIYGYPSIAKDIEAPPANYKLRLFCSTDHPENFEGAETLIKDGITFYLFYTCDEVINI